MARRNAKGFGTTNNYTTIFEKVSDATGGDKKTLSWYKRAVKDLASTYKATPEKLLRQEKRDARDQAQDEKSITKECKRGTPLLTLSTRQ